MKMFTKINGVWNECETVMENSVMKIVNSTPITPEKEYEDFMSCPASIKEFIFNQYLMDYCMMGTSLPVFIVRICKEKGIDFRTLKRAYKKNKTITKFKNQQFTL